MKPPTPHMRTILTRAESVLCTHGQDAAIAYLMQALPNDGLLRRIRPDATPNLRIAIFYAIATLRARRRKRLEETRRELARLQQEAQRQRALEQARIAALRKEKDRLAGAARIRWLASLPPADRDAIATKDERAAAVALRARSITSGKVRLLLSCSARELDAWDKAWLLPHLFTRRIQMGFGSQVARFWLIDDVNAALPHVAEWRRQRGTPRGAASTAPRCRSPHL